MQPGTGRTPSLPASMRRFWDERARENAMWYIHSTLDFQHPDAQAFWRSGEENLDATLDLFGLHISESDRVLEIGCGIGRITRAIAGRAAHVVGIDVSPEMIGRGQEALADVGNVELRTVDGTGLGDFADAAFDVVYSFIVFQHIPDPQVTCAYIRDIGRVLRPGGWTLFQVSDRPEIHDREHWRGARPLRRRLAAAVGRAPRGCLDDAWLGSSVPRGDLTAALAAGGLQTAGTDGDGTQFCFVHARRPG